MNAPICPFLGRQFHAIGGNLIAVPTHSNGCALITDGHSDCIMTAERASWSACRRNPGRDEAPTRPSPTEIANFMGAATVASDHAAATAMALAQANEPDLSNSAEIASEYARGAADACAWVLGTVQTPPKLEPAPQYREQKP